MKKVFVSHSENDQELVQIIKHEILYFFNIQDEEIFCTSDPDTGIAAGEPRLDTMKSAFIESKIIILVVTENFQYSQFCSYEVGATWITWKKNGSRSVLPLIFPPVTNKSAGDLLSSLNLVNLLEDVGLERVKKLIVDKIKVPSVTNTSFAKRWNEQKERIIKKISEYIKNTRFPKRGGYIGSYPLTTDSNFLKDIGRYLRDSKEIILTGICLTFLDDTEKYNYLKLIIDRVAKGETKVDLCLSAIDSQYMKFRFDGECESTRSKCLYHKKESFESLYTDISKPDMRIQLSIFEYPLEFASLIFDKDIFVYPYGVFTPGTKSPVFHFARNESDESDFFVRMAKKIISKSTVIITRNKENS